MRKSSTNISSIRVIALSGLALATLAGCATGTREGTAQVRVHLDDDGQRARVKLSDEVTLELVRIPAGSFLMGSPDTEPQRKDDEGPQHRVTIAEPFYLGTCEVTQAQWQAVMGENPSWHKNDAYPVTNVSRFDALAFCQKLSEKSDWIFRLPSEAEWEYACRAGTTTAYSFGDSPDRLAEYAWYQGDAPRRASPVARKKPNPWGLYDMHGNVWEWCEDAYYPSYEDATGDASPVVARAGDAPPHVLRGGAWFSEAKGGAYYDAASECRCAFRLRRPTIMHSSYIGFRLAAEPR